MGILSFFRKKKKEEGKLKREKEKVVKKKIPKSKKREVKDTKGAYRILLAPQVSERATRLSENNQYVFKVSPGANKQEIARAVKNVYQVNVVKVQITNYPRKKRRLGRFQGYRPAWKKAIVTVARGEKIQLFEGV